MPRRFGVGWRGFTWCGDARGRRYESPIRGKPSGCAQSVARCEGRAQQTRCKNSELFLRLMESLSRTYRRARRLYLILDNYGIHDSRIVRGWLARHPRFKRLFQPVYHPWVNRIERLWKQLHDTVTRNHRCQDLNMLMNAVRRFMEVCQPFPGSQPALAAAG